MATSRSRDDVASRPSRAETAGASRVFFPPVPVGFAPPAVGTLSRYASAAETSSGLGGSWARAGPTIASAATLRQSARCGLLLKRRIAVLPCPVSLAR